MQIEDFFFDINYGYNLKIAIQESSSFHHRGTGIFSALKTI
jgi:hypothetical protein